MNYVKKIRILSIFKPKFFFQALTPNHRVVLSMSLRDEIFAKDDELALNTKGQEDIINLALDYFAIFLKVLESSRSILVTKVSLT